MGGYGWIQAIVQAFYRPLQQPQHLPAAYNAPPLHCGVQQGNRAPRSAAPHFHQKASLQPLHNIAAGLEAIINGLPSSVPGVFPALPIAPSNRPGGRAFGSWMAEGQGGFRFGSPVRRSSMQLFASSVSLTPPAILRIRAPGFYGFCPFLTTGIRGETQADIFRLLGCISVHRTIVPTRFTPTAAFSFPANSVALY